MTAFRPVVEQPRHHQSIDHQRWIDDKTGKPAEMGKVKGDDVVADPGGDAFGKLEELMGIFMEVAKDMDFVGVRLFENTDPYLLGVM